jgi:hypothetical protein
VPSREILWYKGHPLPETRLEILWYQPMGFLGVIRPHRRHEAWSASLLQTFLASCVGAKIPGLEELPLSTCGCKKFALDVHGDHVSTCTAHSGAKKAHD